MLDNRENAVNLGKMAVSEGKAACAQIEGPVTSVYSWKGELQNEEEIRIIFKASSTKVEGLINWIQDRHPYEVPEILAWPTGISNPEYLKWINSA